ncbi:MAG TPA: flagellar biosynthesis protein [Clostridiaceae bacterium]|nr:flagellar biosynthesis protein [Clostridiaceae bacterium]HHV99039.1 flagellar biosynthesis protein [Clostridiaceae bacterium]
MYSRVYKNYQINVGVPFHIKAPVIFQTAECPETLSADDSEATDFMNEESTEKYLRMKQEQADAIIREAELEAERIIEQAHRDSERKKNAVLEEARKKGYEKGYAEGKKQYEDLIEEVQKQKEDSLREYQQTLESLESDIVEIVLDITKKVIGNEIKTNRNVVLNLVREAFVRCTNKEKMILKVSSEDYDYVIENKNEILSTVEGIDDFDVREDPSMKPGSCIIETPFGNVDAGADTKITKIEELFMQAVGR